MPGSHFVFPQSKQDDIPLRNSFSMRHSSNEVCFLSMRFSQALNAFQSNFHDWIKAWLEEYFMKRFPLYGKCYIQLFVNITSSVLIVSTFHDEVFQFIILMFDSHIFVGLEPSVATLVF